MQVYRNVVVLALIIALPLAGCAAIQRSEAKDTEQLLAAADFQAKPADTPEKLADLRSRWQKVGAHPSFGWFPGNRFPLPLVAVEDNTPDEHT
jgi:hypothetical protein